MKKRKRMIMWNGVDLELFMKSHNMECVYTVMQTLQIFGTGNWEKQAVEYLKELVDKYHPGIKSKAEIVKRKHKSYGLPKLYLIVGTCPRCGEPLYGENLRGCEERKTGRIFLRLCYNCDYYAEIFKKDGKIIEIEEGE